MAMASGGTMNLLQLLAPRGEDSALSKIGKTLGGPVGGFGLDLIGSLLETRSERRRLEELRGALTDTLKPQEASLEMRKTGLSQTEGRVAEGATTGALTDLANRNVLDSSFAPGEVAMATAPLELRRQTDIDTKEKEIAGAKQQIAALTSVPGYGAAFGGTFGDVGEFLALRGGREEGQQRSRRLLEEKLDSLLELMT
jgi:hypothetical protein